MFVKSFLLILFLLETIVIIKSNESENNAISVTIKNVKINGRKEKIDGKDVNVFLGIPYAEPPTGELRFKKPLPVKQSAQIIDATEWPNPCFQIPMLPQNFNNKNFSEDCLYLNIWSPLISDTSDELKPVMFWIHGGALLIGSSVEYYFNGEVLSTKGDVVVVTINYRLGPFGFLYTGTDDAPGNMGLWDQALALEWVNDNIKYFGGDPQKITVFGESAGAWSTNLHIVSPITRNLFNNAIMMSGSAINNMAGDEPQNIMNSWIKGAKVVGCTDEQNSNENSFTPKMIECFKNSAPEKLASIVFLPEMKSGLIGWMPQVVVDGQFLPKKPLSMLKSGDYKKNLNLLIGTTEDEGSFLLPFEVDNIKYNAFSPQNLTFSEAYDELKRITSILPSKIPINGEDVAKLYFTGLSDNNDFDLLRRTIGIAIGDYLLGCPNIQFAKTLFKNDRKNNKVYQYYYNSKLGDPQKIVCSKWMGACHTDDIWPVFGVAFSKFDSHLDREREISAQMIDIFSHFSRTGQPSPQNGVEWPKYYTINDKIIAPYYEITNEPKAVTNFGNGLKINECEYLWKKYMDKK